MTTTLLRAGAAEGDITPQKNLPNYNGTEMETDTSLPEGEASADTTVKAGPLKCKVLALAAGDKTVEKQGETVIKLDETVVFVACDLTFIDRSLVLRIRDECRWRLNLSPDKIMVTATHTHNAPTVCHTFLTGGKPDPIYLDFLVSQIVATTQKALSNMEEVLVGSGVIPAPAFTGNRRRLRPGGGITFIDSQEHWELNLPPEGPVDPYMSYLFFETPEGRPLAFMVTLSCHNNCCDTFGSGGYHGDFYGSIADALQKNLPSLKSVLSLPAPAGNILWKKESEDNNLCGGALAESIGERCASLLFDAYIKSERKEVGSIKMLCEAFYMRDRGPEESTICDDGCRGDSQWELEFARLRYEPESAAVQERGETGCLVEIAAIAFDDTVIATNPAELFVEYGLQIREESPFPVTMVLELTNGYCGYVPTGEAFNNKGYETHRTVYTSRLKKEAGDLIAAKSLDMINSLYDSLDGLAAK